MKHQFKTDMNCAGCIEALTPYPDTNNEIMHWQIDIDSPYKILTVETDKLSDEMIRQIVKRAGYKAENLNQ